MEIPHLNYSFVLTDGYLGGVHHLVVVDDTFMNIYLHFCMAVY